MNTPPIQDEGPGVDPGGPFRLALLHVLRDVALGQIGDWIDGPPGWWWMSVETGTFIATWWMLLLGPPTASVRAYIALHYFGVLYVSFLGGTFAIWAGTKVLRLKYQGGA